MEQSQNARPVLRVSQSNPNTHSNRADSVEGIQVAPVQRAARVQPRNERAVPRVTSVPRSNQARQI